MSYFGSSLRSVPFKSEAQRRKIFELEKQGKVPKGTAAEWQAATPKGKLPERVNKPPKSTKVGKIKFAKVIK